MRKFDIGDEINKKNFANDPKKLADILEGEEKKKEKYMYSIIMTGYCSQKKVFNDKEWCEKALEELERRKIANTEILRSYGLDI